MLSTVGWINGISSTIILLFGCIFGIYLIYKGKVSRARLISISGIFMLFSGIGHLGNFIDFLTILTTGNNLSDPNLLIYFWYAPTFPVLLSIVYLVAEFIIPEKKWYVFSILAIILIYMGIILFIDPINSFSLRMPDNPGEDLIDDALKADSSLFNMALIVLLTISIFTIIGFSVRIHESEGLLRKKYIYLALGFIFWFIFYAVLDTILDPGVILYIVRIGVIFSFIFLFLGLKEESAEPKEKPKKEIKVEGGLFRVTKRPSKITEEEVTFHKEQKICLVCKGKVEGYNIFICRSCDVLYCQNCAQALENLENMCWVCNEPINEAKPVNLYKEEDEAVITKEKTHEKGE